MSDAIRSALHCLAAGKSLTEAELSNCFSALLSGETPPEQTGAFLMGLAVRGERGTELLAGAMALRATARTITLEGDILDTCGTGGLGWTSLNTSTASAIVIAACGGKVAKHGNRSVPPKTGSADVLEAFGVNLEPSETAFRQCIEDAGVGFLFARSHHSAMRHVAPVRASLGIRTIFNLLGPLSNPARATHQVLGVYDPAWLRPMAEALNGLEVQSAWVVHGHKVTDRALDELSVEGPTSVIEVKNGVLREFELTPQSVGLRPSPLSELEGGTPVYNAKAIADLLNGTHSVFRTAVALNAAAGLNVLGISSTLEDGISRAMAVLDDGTARETLSRLISASCSDT